MKQELLTANLYQQLIGNGFRYLVIEDVITSSSLSSIVVNPRRSIPAGITHSCTGIEDGMIKSLVNGDLDDFKIFYTPFQIV